MLNELTTSQRAIREGKRLVHRPQPYRTNATDTSGITSAIETVTPEIAARWLLNNTHNRTLKDKAIRRYAGDMAAGRWDVNGDPIRFDRDGVLLDGQNRLHAVILANASIETLVVRGLEPGSQETMDVGVPRGLSDVLHLRGETAAKELAAAILSIHRFETNPRDMSSSVVPSIHESILLLDRHPNLRESVRIAGQVRKAVGLRVSIGAGLHYLTSSIDSEDAEAFWERLASGAELDADDPILLLRNQILADRVKAQQRMTYTRTWALTVKAWNAYREGRKVKLLTWRPGGANPEPMPIPA